MALLPYGRIPLTEALQRVDWPMFQRLGAAGLVHTFFDLPDGHEQPVPPRFYRIDGVIDHKAGTGRRRGPPIELGPPGSVHLHQPSIIRLSPREGVLSAVGVGLPGMDDEWLPISVDNDSLTNALQKIEKDQRPGDPKAPLRGHRDCEEFFFNRMSGSRGTTTKGELIGEAKKQWPKLLDFHIDIARKAALDKLPLERREEWTRRGRPPRR